MAAYLAYPTLSFQYEAIDIRTLDGETLLASPALEDNLLALLCRLANPRQAIRRLLARIAAVAGTARDDAIAQLLVLSGLRRLHPLVIEETRTMPILINIRENPFFREVFEEGKQEGHQEGRQEGRQEGCQEGHKEEAVALLCRQLEHRFGPLPAATRQQIEAADTPTLETWSLRVLDATSLEDVLRMP
jgi:predicted transposase YdaD